MDGVFETGLDVIEHEVDLGSGAKAEIERLLNEGKITQAQHEELLMRHLNQQKIFAYGSYDEFYGAYFENHRTLVADEHVRRIPPGQNAQAPQRPRQVFGLAQPPDLINPKFTFTSISPYFAR